MIYVEVECPECNEINQIDETLKKFFCVNCGAEVKVEYEAICEPEDGDAARRGRGPFVFRPQTKAERGFRLKG